MRSPAEPYLPLLLAILAIAGCQRTRSNPSAEDEPSKAAAPSESKTGATNKESKYLEFAQRLESLVADDKANELPKLIGWSEFVDRTFAGIPIAKDEKELYTNIWRDSNLFLGAVGSAVAEGATYRFLRIKPDGHRRLAVFRLLQPAGGVNYHEMQLTAGTDGAVHIRDIYIYTSGRWLSESIRRSMLLEEGLQKPAWQAAVKDGEKQLIQNTAALKNLDQEIEEGNFQAALDEYGLLPADLQQSLPLLLLRMGAAEQVDPAACQSAFGELRRLFPTNPAVDLKSIDYYYTARQFEEERKAIGRLDRRTGGDPYLQILIATSFLEQNDWAAAAEHADNAIQREPTLPGAYWTRITVALGAKDYPKVVSLLNTIETKLNIRVDNLASRPDYAEFVKSDEFAQWQASRPQPAENPSVDDQPADDDMSADEDE
jgi:hypothetical protein